MCWKLTHSRIILLLSWVICLGGLCWQELCATLMADWWLKCFVSRFQIRPTSRPLLAERDWVLTRNGLNRNWPITSVLTTRIAWACSTSMDSLQKSRNTLSTGLTKCALTLPRQGIGRTLGSEGWGVSQLRLCVAIPFFGVMITDVCESEAPFFVQLCLLWPGRKPILNRLFQIT